MPSSGEITDTSSINLLYNHLIRLSRPQSLLSSVIPFIPDDKIEMGKTYLERSGYRTTMEKQLSKESGEYRYGYLFLGDNGIYYKENGKTTIDDSSSLNEIIAIIVE